MIISPLSATERTAQVCRAATRFCAFRGWTPVHEMPLPNGRRADILALEPDGCFVVVEVKSCARDFLTDSKWPEYRDYCDRLFFAVDLDFPQELLPEDAGLLVADLSFISVTTVLPAVLSTTELLASFPLISEGLDWLPWRTRAPCFWMRFPKSRLRFRSVCCAFCRKKKKTSISSRRSSSLSSATLIEKRKPLSKQPIKSPICEKMPWQNPIVARKSAKNWRGAEKNT